MTRLMVRAGVAAFTLAATMTAALAQTAAPAPAAPIVAPPPIAAPAAPAAPALSAAHLEAAMEVAKLSGMTRSTDTLIPQTVDKARQLFTQMRPELAADIDKSIKALQPDFDGLVGESQKIVAQAFGARLSEGELKDIAAFFKSAAGQKFVSAQPGILDDMFRDMEPFTQRLSQTVVDKLRDDLKKRGAPF